MKTMKRVTFFFLLFFVLSVTFKGQAQTLTASLDSLVASFEIKNKKAIQVRPNTIAAKNYAQKNAADLLYILDDFFTTGQYRKANTIKANQCLVTAQLSEQTVTVDSFLSVVYVLELPGASSYNNELKPGIFLPVKSRPTKVPEQFYIGLLDEQRLVLVAIVASMQREEAAAARRKERVTTYLNWIREKYQ